MSTDKPKKAVWPIADRAADLESSESWQRVQGRAYDTRKQTKNLPDRKARKGAKKHD